MSDRIITRMGLRQVEKGDAGRKANEQPRAQAGLRAGRRFTGRHPPA
ncbi:MAG TPA: hypothetical protein VES89_05145 [Candidatus Competibacteraceae bacterium]|nr:hypothetical protein [Candidatus Competibacteraceae bacterium]